MPGTSHEQLTVLLRSNPELLQRLIALGNPNAVAPVLPPLADSTVRSLTPAEYHPDLLFAEGDTGPWTICEPQRQIDDAKRTTWPQLLAMVNHQRKCMGDLIVITHKRSVARWAGKLMKFTGPLGTILHYRAKVILIDSVAAEQLLQVGRYPEAMAAAWAVHDRRGNSATKLASRALKVVLNTAPEPLLLPLSYSILYSLHPALAAKVIQVMKNDSEPTERDKVRHLFADFIAQGKAEGLREALIAALSRRGIAVSKTATQRIEHCTDAAQLQRWLLNAMTAEKLRDIW